MNRLIIRNGRLILPNGIKNGLALICADGKIIDIKEERSYDIQDDDEVIDAYGRYVSPGFIDIHVHGGGGHDFLDGSVEAFLTIANMHARHGTTGIVPTLATCPNCGATVMYHHVCPECGYYRGRQIIEKNVE